MKIGFIGLGIMGESMSWNIVKKHDDTVYVFDFVKEKTELLASRGTGKEFGRNHFHGAKVRAFKVCVYGNPGRAGLHQDLHRHEHHRPKRIRGDCRNGEEDWRRIHLRAGCEIKTRCRGR